MLMVMLDAIRERATRVSYAMGRRGLRCHDCRRRASVPADSSLRVRTVGSPAHCSDADGARDARSGAGRARASPHRAHGHRDRRPRVAQSVPGDRPAARDRRGHRRCAARAVAARRDLSGRLSVRPGAVGRSLLSASSPSSVSCCTCSWSASSSIPTCCEGRCTPPSPRHTRASSCRSCWAAPWRCSSIRGSRAPTSRSRASRCSSASRCRSRPFPCWRASCRSSA